MKKTVGINLGVLAREVEREEREEREGQKKLEELIGQS